MLLLRLENVQPSGPDNEKFLALYCLHVIDSTIVSDPMLYHLPSLLITLKNTLSPQYGLIPHTLGTSLRAWRVVGAML